MSRTGELRERITLLRLNLASEAYEPLVPDMTAAVEALGEDRYHFRIRSRPDLRSREDTEPAMIVLWRGRTLDLEDVLTFAATLDQETQLVAAVRTIETPDLRGHHRHQSWP